MDEGRLTDSYGRTVDFKNTVIIMTSNIGTRQLKEFGKGIGFAAQTRTDDKEYSRSVITKALNKSFAPEFINRLDEIITFDQLDINALEKIIDIDIYKRYKLFVWVILNDMYNLDIKAVCAKNARTGMMIKMLQLHRHPHSYSEPVAGRHHQGLTKQSTLYLDLLDSLGTLPL
jgi:hypothetical protein